MAAPTSGASQNTHSCAGAPSPLKNATPVERAGFTDVFEIGIEIRWISVRRQADCQTREPLRGAVVGGAEDHEQEDER